MKTLVISSSLSARSRSFLLCRRAAELLEQRGVELRFVDARDVELTPTHRGATEGMQELTTKVAWADSLVFGMGVHCYSVNDSLKIILDNCCGEATGKLFGVLCAAGGERSYLSTMHLTQICMNEWRMMQLPRIVYATGGDFEGDKISNADIEQRLETFADEFSSVGEKLSN